MYSTQNVKDDLDAVAWIQDAVGTLLGTGSEEGSVSARAAQIEARVLATAEYDVANKLLDGIHEFSEACKTTSGASGVQSTLGVMGQRYWNGLRNYLGDIKTGLNGRDVRMHPAAAENYKLANGGVWPDPSCVFALQTELADAVRAAGTWTATADEDGIDPVKYSGAQLVIKCVDVIGAADVNVALRLLRTGAAGEDPVSLTVQVPANSIKDAEISVGLDHYVRVHSITVTGGTNGDHVKVMSVQERDPLA